MGNKSAQIQDDTWITHYWSSAKSCMGRNKRIYLHRRYPARCPVPSKLPTTLPDMSQHHTNFMLSTSFWKSSSTMYVQGLSHENLGIIIRLSVILFIVLCHTMVSQSILPIYFNRVTSYPRMSHTIGQRKGNKYILAAENVTKQFEWWEASNTVGSWNLSL